MGPGHIDLQCSTGKRNKTCVCPCEIQCEFSLGVASIVDATRSRKQSRRREFDSPTKNPDKYYSHATNLYPIINNYLDIAISYRGQTFQAGTEQTSGSNSISFCGFLYQEKYHLLYF